MEMLSYLGLEYATALVKEKRLKWYWNSNGELVDLFGNTFFKTTMSANLFFLIRRGFQDDLKKLMQHYNLISRKYWNPSDIICFDDDLEKCEARTKERMHIPRKA